MTTKQTPLVDLMRIHADDVHSAHGYNKTSHLLSQAADEIERLRHDIERHIAMTSELATENEALRTELAAPPSEAMIQSGSDMASLLMNVSVAVCMNGLGGSITTEEWEALDVPNKDLAEQYGREELDSVTAIYIAMRRAAMAGGE